MQRGLRLAWRGRDRLGSRDQAMLDAVAGPNYPNPTPSRQLLQARERYTTQAPDRPDAWYLLGDHLFHYGHLYEDLDYRERALDAFKRAVDLDTTYVVPTLHGLDLAVLVGDSAAVRRFERMRIDADSTRAWEPIYRWYLAERTGDTVRAQAIYDSLLALNPQFVLPVVQHAVYDGTGARYIPSLLEALRTEAMARGQSTGMLRSFHDILLPLGRPRAARAIVDSMFAEDSELNALIVRARDGLVGGGDSADAAEAVALLERVHRGPSLSEAVRRRRTLAILRVTEPWRLAHGDTSTVRRSLTELRAAIRADSMRSWDAEMDVVMLEAMYADVAGASNSRVATERLDSLLRGLDYSIQNVGRREMANLVAARLLERAGEPRRALAAVRRRGDMWTPAHPYLATQLREEGRLAALVGEREQAIVAYRHYLGLRYDPEPSLAAEVNEVRKELARLMGASVGR